MSPILILLLCLVLLFLVAILAGSRRVHRPGRSGRRPRRVTVTLGLVVLASLVAATPRWREAGARFLPRGAELPETILVPPEASAATESGDGAFRSGKVLATVLVFRGNLVHPSRLEGMTQSPVDLRVKGAPGVTAAHMKLAIEGRFWRVRLSIFRGNVNGRKVSYNVSITQYEPDPLGRETRSLSTSRDWEDFGKTEAVALLPPVHTAPGIDLGLLPRPPRQISAPVLYLSWLPPGSDPFEIDATTITREVQPTSGESRKVASFLEGLGTTPISTLDSSEHASSSRVAPISAGLQLFPVYGVNFLLLALAVGLLSQAFPSRPLGFLILTTTALALLVTVDLGLVHRAREVVTRTDSTVPQRLDALEDLKSSFFFEDSARSAVRQLLARKGIAQPVAAAARRLFPETAAEVSSDSTQPEPRSD